jgi:hypothetical protein
MQSFFRFSCCPFVAVPPCLHAVLDAVSGLRERRKEGCGMLGRVGDDRCEDVRTRRRGAVEDSFLERFYRLILWLGGGLWLWTDGSSIYR